MRTRLLLLFLSVCPYGFAQNILTETLSPLPEPVTNNAVAAARVADEWYVYSFTGLDSTKSCAGDHLRAYRYRVSADTWEALPDVPDPSGGKIAAAASVVKGKIYVVGGYHLGGNCNEISSAKTHVFDPAANAWLPDAAPLPVPIDDQVQGVWRDSLLYVISGWSNTTNVPTVQIYDPATDTWQSGTAVPNSNRYKAFGASGTIIGDTIYYAGGAVIAGNFPLRAVYRKGVIDPNAPTSITWSDADAPAALLYRSGATQYRGRPIWLGGSAVSYNFDGIAYNGSGGVAPLSDLVVGSAETDTLERLPGVLPPTMDLRGVAALDADTYILVGGMGPGQTVRPTTTRLRIDALTAAGAVTTAADWTVYPNPNAGTLHFSAPLSGQLDFYGADGRRRYRYTLRGQRSVRINGVAPGVYFVQLRVGARDRGLRQLVVLP